MEAITNVVVIGGGIIGSSIAWHLAPNTHVTVVAEKLGGVATPLSFAWVNDYTSDDTYYHFRNRSMEHWMEIHDQLPGSPIRFTGGLVFMNSSEEQQEYYDLQKSRGYNVIHVNSTEIQELEPQLTDEYTPDWAVYAPEEGQMEAELVARDFLRHSEDVGATVLERTVSGFLKDHHGNVKGVKTPQGNIKADHVVLAAGLGSVDLLAAENITLPVEPREGLLVNSLPTSPGTVQTVFNGYPLHMRQTSYGVIRSSLDFMGGDPGDDPQGEADEVFAMTQDALVNGHELVYSNYTIGRRPQPEDGFPILGATGLNGLSVAVMHSGVTNAAIVGQLMAKLVLTNVTDPLMKPFLLSRF